MSDHNARSPTTSTPLLSWSALGVQEWPLVGRQVELEHLCTLLVDGSSNGVLIVAEPGLGKTRLAMEGLQFARGRGFVTARVTATVAASGVPLGCLAPLLPADDLPGAGDRSELLRRTVHTLAARADGSRFVLVVDDAHLLDDLSATVVQQLALTTATFVLGTARLGEPTPDPILALWKDNLVDRLEIEALNADAVHELVERVLGGRVDDRTSGDLAIRTQGNPLFIREVVLGALHDGTLRASHGVWRMSGPSRPSRRLIELVEARIGKVEADERQLMELLAFGEPIGPAQIARLRDPDSHQRLERAGLVASRFDGRRLEVRLAHPLYGEVVRARTPLTRAQEIERLLAESVEEEGARRREDVLRIGTWRLTAGGGRPDLMFAAARTARSRHDFSLAERLARAAVDQGGGFEAALFAANLAMLQGRSDGAECELELLASEATTEEQRARVAVMRLDNIIWCSGALSRAAAIADSAEAALTDRSSRDEITTRRAWITMLAHRQDEALALSETLLKRASGPPLVWACATASFCLLNRGHFDRALDLAARAESLRCELTESLERYPWQHEDVRCTALQAAGRLDEAMAVAEAQYQQALADNSPDAQGTFALHLARTELLRGRIRSAAKLAEETIAVFRQLGQPSKIRQGLGRLAMAFALGGRADDAARAFAEARTLIRPDTTLSVIEDSEAQAWVTAALGNLPQARDELRTAALTKEATGHLWRAASAWHAIGRLGDPSEASKRLVALAQIIEGDMVQAQAAHASALARQDPAGLADAATRFEALGAMLFAAEAAADAALCARRAEGRRRWAALQRQAARLAARCEGATTPALQLLEAQVQLTAAERDAAVLAAAGRSNRAIAEELCISVRTVESRLQNAYGKLGISDREHLSEALEPPAPPMGWSVTSAP